MGKTRRRWLGILLAGLCLVAAGSDWPRFRGPDGTGVGPSSSLPTKCDDSAAVVWKTELPGRGASSPIVVGQRVYLTCYSGYGLDEDEPGDMSQLTRHVLCYELASGQLVWNTPLKSADQERPYRGFQALHGFASSTPVSDGESIYVFFGRAGVSRLSLDGQMQWTQKVGDKTHNWGSASSPLLHENLVLVNASVESGSVVALDKSTGKVVWEASDIKSAWNTPALVTTEKGAVELAINTKNGIEAYDPLTGGKLWWCDGFDDYICPSMVAHDGILYALGARRSTAAAIRAGGRGDVTESHRLWVTRKGSNVSSPVYHDGHLYWVHDSRGTAYCANVDTGEIVYEERLDPRPGKIYASPLIADGKLYIVSRTKGVYVLEAAPRFELLAHNEPLDSSVFNGSPAVVDGKLLLRSDSHLYCLGK